jgi:hypothetical protein
MTLTQKFASFPPILVRLLARNKRLPLTPIEISSRSQTWGTHYIEALSRETNWGTTSVTDAITFCRACGLDLDDAEIWRRTVDYLSRKPTFRYLRTSPEWKSYYQPMLKRWVQCCYPYREHTIAPVRQLIERLAPTVK